MKVYVKKGEYQSPIPGIITIIIFLSFAFGLLNEMLKYNNFIDILANVGIGIFVAIFFFCFGIYFFYLLIKKPKKYTAKLISKVPTKYKGKDIIYMTFKVIKNINRQDDLTSDIYKCFTYEENDFIINNLYNIYLKEFNWKIKKIEDKHDDLIIKAPATSMKPVFISIIGFFSANILLSILGIIYYKEFSFTYILMILIFTPVTLFSIKFFKEYEHNQNNNNNNNEEEK